MRITITRRLKSRLLTHKSLTPHRARILNQHVDNRRKEASTARRWTSLSLATQDEHDRSWYPSGAATNGGVGLGIQTDLPDYSTSNCAHVAAQAEGDEEEDSDKDDTNMSTDGMDADGVFMDGEDRLIRHDGIEIPIELVSSCNVWMSASGSDRIVAPQDGKPAPLLPPISVEHNGRKCLVLDLDETLPHSSFKVNAVEKDLNRRRNWLSFLLDHAVRRLYRSGGNRVTKL
jgi:hypothetical protein